MLVRKRKLKLKDTEEYEIVSRKAEKREKSRGVKALKISRGRKTYRNGTNE